MSEDTRLRGDERRVDVASDRPLGETLLDISNGIVRTHKECIGKGPTKARTHLAGDDCVICVLEGGFSTAERTLETAGRSDAVDAQRVALQQVVKERFIEIVERALGRRVRSFMSASDAPNETQVEVFLLEGHEGTREGLRRQAEQARRHNRDVLEEHRALRAEQRQARGNKPRV